MPGLRKVIPIVADGYGWNLYAMYKDGISIGALGSTFKSAPNKLMFTDILDAEGHIAGGKMFHTFKGKPGQEEYTEFATPSGEMKIGGDETFIDAGAVGMWFQYAFDVEFYKPASETTPTPTPEPELPDLSVVGFREASYEALLAVTSHVRVRNDGAIALAGVQVTLDVEGGGAVRPAYVDLAPGEEKDVAFEWWTGERAGTRSAAASVNPSRAVAERDYTNNARTFVVDVKDALVDLSVTGIVPSRYPANTYAITLVNVRNDSRRAVGVGRGETAMVSLEVPGVGFWQARSAVLPPGETVQVPFGWSAKTDLRVLAMTATVNYDKKIVETDYSNNTYSTSATLFVDNNPPYATDINRRTWEETVLLAPAYPPGSPPVLAPVQYYAQVSMAATLSDREIKSGYGVECLVTTTLATDYPDTLAAGDPDAGVVVGIQNVFAYLPTDGYSKAVQLEHVWTSADSKTSTWRFPQNAASVIRARRQYIPVEWPDGKPFEIRFMGYDAFCPGGAMSASASASVMVNGNMYEDDYTAPSQ